MAMDIEGSLLEGGGQILRMALCFSVLCKKPIRGGRKKLGLMAQYMKGIELLRDICSAQVTGLELDSMEVEFHPGDIGAGKYVASSCSDGWQCELVAAVHTTGGYLRVRSYYARSQGRNQRGNGPSG